MLASCLPFQANRWLLPVVLAVLQQQAHAQTCCAPAGTDVVAWWSLDETTGSVAAEHTGLHSGTHIGGPTTTAGMVLGALAFDGVDDHVTVADSPVWTFTADFTIELWTR